MRVLQINTTLNTSSTGNIAQQISNILISDGSEGYLAYGGRYPRNNNYKNTIRIGNKFDFVFHAIITRLFDQHGFGSKRATKTFVKKIDKIKPDIIHLHNLHGYYINIEILFNYLTSKKIPVVWTMHDCWAFTGHCDHFDYVGCSKWQVACHTCPQKKLYPASKLFDNSKANFVKKRLLFNSPTNLTIVPVSNWLESKLELSFFRNFSIEVIKNGIDLNDFKKTADKNFEKRFNTQGKTVLLGVASIWSKKKGFYEFIKLGKLLKKSFLIILVGDCSKIKIDLPENIISIEKVTDKVEMAKIYSQSDLFLNLSFEDTYPTTNLESIACGTSVITYKTGGSPESIEDGAGYLIKKGDTEALVEKILEITSQPSLMKSYEDLRLIATEKFNKDINFKSYIKLYKKILSGF
jgi:glycosyltransferase involved in cell wall biosynthesis